MGSRVPQAGPRAGERVGGLDGAESSEADLGPVLASIKAHLPLTLQQLDVKESEPLRDALREAERAQRKREQAPSEEKLKIEREALDRLAALIQEPQHGKFLWKRVNEADATVRLRTRTACCWSSRRTRTMRLQRPPRSRVGRCRSATRRLFDPSPRT